MKIKRFQAADMRQALRQVRETLGPDAVILSNRKIDEGIELVAAVDFDETSFAEAQREQAEAAAAPAPANQMRPGRASMDDRTSTQVARMAKAQMGTGQFGAAQPGAARTGAARPNVAQPHVTKSHVTNSGTDKRPAEGATISGRQPMPVNGYRTQPAAKPMGSSWLEASLDDEPMAADTWSPSSPAPVADKGTQNAKGGRNDSFLSSASQIHVKPKAEPKTDQARPEQTRGASSKTEDESSESPILLEMRREMENMRRMMLNEFSMLGWEEMGRKRPDAQELFRRLMSLDLSADLCHGLARKVEQMEDTDQAWRKALAILAASLPVYKGDLLDEGGLVALVGPTGVGKTTSLAKLAARFCLRHGNRHLGLISADAWRLGGQEQLVQYARLLDVPVRSVNSTRDLEIAINAFADKRLVLIDTAGMGQRDARLAEQLSLLTAGRKPLRTFLTLSSNTQQAALEQAMQAFGQVSPQGCIITKVDEAASLGGVFSALIRQGLPLAFITDGQRVPEDIHLPRTQALVNRAVNMSQQFAIGHTDQYMALSLGGLRADAHP